MGFATDSSLAGSLSSHAKMMKDLFGSEGDRTPEGAGDVSPARSSGPDEGAVGVSPASTPRILDTDDDVGSCGGQRARQRGR